MGLQYTPIIETKTAAEILSGYRRICAKPKAPVVSVSAFPAKVAPIEDQERDFMVCAHQEIMQPVSDPNLIVPISAILSACARAANISIEEIKADRRVRSIMVARLAYYYIARRHTHLSFPAIGRLVGGRDHTTVLSGVNRVQRAIDTDEKPITQVLFSALKILEEGK